MNTQNTTNTNIQYKSNVFLLSISSIIVYIFIIFMVQLLWNNVITDVFKLTEITYFQSFGLVILARILFGTTCVFSS